jgi:hypothetical protein
MAAKPQDYNEYARGDTELVERVLLEVWASLGEFRQDMVLVGGLAPRYMFGTAGDGGTETAHCGTMDIDLGLSVAIADKNTYGQLRSTIIDRLGFRPGTNLRGRDQRHSFVKTVDHVDIYIDFLTAVYGGPANSRMREMEQEISAIQVKGLGLALLDPLKVNISGELLGGGLTTETVNVCRLIPFVVLKALSFADRGEPKDAYDLVYALRNAAGNPAELAKQVREEERESEFWPEMLDSLCRNFESPEHKGAVRYASFLGNVTEAAQAFAAVQGFLQGLGARD